MPPSLLAPSRPWKTLAPTTGLALPMRVSFAVPELSSLTRPALRTLGMKRQSDSMSEAQAFSPFMIDPANLLRSHVL